MEKEKIYKVYYLYDVRELENIRYVGMTERKLYQRKASHFCEVKKDNIKKYNWLHSAGKENVEIKTILKTTSKKLAENFEYVLTKFYKIKYTDLLNMQCGNDRSNHIGKKHSVLTKNKMSESHKGSKRSQETKIKMSENHHDCSKEKHPKYKEINEQVVFTLKKEGFSNKEISEILILSRTTVYKILKGTRFKN